MSASFKIELTMLPQADMHRLVKDSVRQSKINSAPYGKRKKMMEDDDGCCPECGEEDCDCDDAEMMENDTKVEMARGGSLPATSNVNSEDLPRGVKLPKVAKKNGKKP